MQHLKGWDVARDSCVHRDDTQALSALTCVICGKHSADMAVCCSFTLEASFAGPSKGTPAGSHYTSDHLKQVGAALCLALLDYTNPSTVTEALREMGAMVMLQLQSPTSVLEEAERLAQQVAGMQPGSPANIELKV